MFAAMQSLQEEPPCDVNVIPTKELASLAPSDITTNRSCLVPIINVVEEVDNFGESNNVEEDKENILKLETHTMPPPRVINKGYLVQELLPIHAQEDPYMIQLLGCQRYINIVSNVPIRWVVGVCSSLKFCSSLFFYHSICFGLLLLFLMSAYVFSVVCLFKP